MSEHGSTSCFPKHVSSITATEAEPEPEFAAVDEDRERLLGTPALSDDTLRRTSLFDNALDTHSQLDETRIQETRGSLTYLNGLALVISLQIGSGIFSTPSEVSKHVTSSTTGVSVWLMAGLLVWTGAASFIELGRAIPHNGGVQEYLRRCYGDFYAFLFSWIWITISKPCSVAIIATIFAEHLNSALLPDSWSLIWVNKLIAIVGVVLITVMNCLGTNTGAYVANFFLVLKLFALFSIVVIGLGAGSRSDPTDDSTATNSSWPNSRHDSIPTLPSTQATQKNVWSMIGDYVTAVFGALFCYGGWETVGFVAGEMKNPFRDLPRVIHSAMSIVLLGFVLMNVSLYMVLPIEAIRDHKTVAVTFGLYVFGSSGGLAYSLVVAMSCLGALNANVFATGRLCVAASRRNYFPKFLGDPGCHSKEEEPAYYKKLMKGWPSLGISSLLLIAKWTERVRWEKQVPVYAMVLNALFASFYIIIGTFGSLLTFIGISEYLFFFFAVLGVFVLRRQSNPRESVPRTWSINPIIFCAVSGFLVLRGIITDLMQGLAILFFIVLGLIARYFLASGRPISTEVSNL